MTKLGTLFIFMIIILCGLSVVAQNSRLANEYFLNGEYEKAASLFDKLNQKHPTNPYYFERYVASLIEMGEIDMAKEAVQGAMKADPKNPVILVSAGDLAEKEGNIVAAEKYYNEAISKLTDNSGMIQQLASAFSKRKLNVYAIKVYEKGRALFNDRFKYNYQLADLYRKEDETEKMTESYLYSLKESPNRIDQVKTYFHRFLNEDEFDNLLEQLYDFTSNFPEALVYPELLEWYFIIQKDYTNAFRQVKALDSRLDENGYRIYNVATIAYNEEDYEAAIKGYKYIVETKDPNSSYFIESQRSLLRTKQKKIVRNATYTRQELLDLESEYVRFFEQNERDVNTATISIQFAQFEAYYLNNLEVAKEELIHLIALPGLNKYSAANAKINLADIYLILDEIWEASLLYSQVDKAFGEDILGHRARFKNAKLSYYNSDFEWAQKQFDVLRSSTSKLIANDALDLSIFIQDNLGLDTTSIPMSMYAQADLLTFQNKYEEAFNELDNLTSLYPEHGLLDDIYYLQGQLYTKIMDYDLALEKYQNVIDNYADDIRADNSLYNSALIYQDILNQPEKAQNLYEKIFIDYSSSIFAVDARKRFRALRGDDKINKSDMSNEDLFMRGLKRTN